MKGVESFSDVSIYDGLVLSHIIQRAGRMLIALHSSKCHLNELLLIAIYIVWIFVLVDVDLYLIVDWVIVRCLYIVGIQLTM